MSEDNETLIYHNPKCSKSRQTLQLLNDRGETPTVIEYLKEPLSEQRLKEMLEQLGQDILRTGEPEYQQLALSQDSTHDEILVAIAQHPKLLQRPIVVKNGKAIIGRPPEQVLDLF
jgi:arsenate reductase